MTTKNKTKHTPGPWYTDTRNGQQVSVNFNTQDVPAYWGVGNGRAAVAHALITGSVAGDEAKANARLIAAAPELLKAAKNVTAHLRGDLLSLKDHAVLDLLRAAIAKAEGAQ